MDFNDNKSNTAVASQDRPSRLKQIDSNAALWLRCQHCHHDNKFWAGYLMIIISVLIPYSEVFSQNKQEKKQQLVNVEQ